MTEYTHYHNPRVGRCGNMVELRDDTGWCQQDRRVLEDDYCECHPGSIGGVFSKIMSAPLSYKAKEQDARLFKTVRERADDEVALMFEDEETQEYIEFEMRQRREFETYDLSLANGELYNNRKM